MLALREWRHIKMCKRAGRGHSLSGIGGTEAGGLSVQCRACPLPGVNLPDGWESAPEELKYASQDTIHAVTHTYPDIYMLYI